MTPAEFVDALNTNAGGPLSQPERNQLVSDLPTGTRTQAQVLRAIAEDPDLNNAEFNRAFVLMQYFGYLRRNPNDPQDTDYTGYDFWLTKLNQFNGNFVNAEMVKAFIISGNTGSVSGVENGECLGACSAGSLSAEGFVWIGSLAYGESPFSLSNSDYGCKAIPMLADV